MPRPIALMTIAASLSLAACASADPFLPVPPASFINYHVDTVRQLSQQIAVDAVVRGRLSRHFHIAQPDMVTYVRRNLVLSYLGAPGVYRVACVSPAGREYYVTQRLPKGTAVFALASTGKPILKRACGNPLVSSLPAVAPSKMAQKGGNHQGGNHSEEEALAETPTTTDAPTDLVASNTVPGTTTLTDTPLAGTNVGDLSPFTRVAGITQSLSPGLGGGGLIIPGIVTAIAGTQLFKGGGSSSTVPVTVPVINPVPAPEPSALAVYGLGGLSLLARVVRRRRAL